ncbi:glycine cleavage system aminomethyltransferase GcvT [Pseudomonas extremorientalis]|jgi:aminomethyltransferase|uniref:aminomethyltransferase n=1 Tax=Pseudomonas extremorientalis TaxID=169669 RepID=A0A1H0PS50_9PSED|nr:glycine cleavage system aminomethyltransferase GcvT [Pseudomonas extremorientalis]KAB0521972.1 glycine cleavage system aminomethyltransferase GcvT [Pseudomonas extremorientalis]OIN10845.1 glycine cleavage system protein T [Pseudomonas extremorientalis]UUN87672.1 glycine cleavage system aminomethyltransferase GcvT [Pseudomonas extremorientalis]WLG55752.1 glycine cleavage system aminomethyltransferase GcvT [Pseudomonas extremorientalis]SDP07630.1 aminomethyltransferase [Pseudomonas extremorie
MSTETLLKTPLHALHLELGARMVPFAGYDMPVQYPLGVMKEHLHTRDQAGLFDVSHMGQIRLTGANAAKALETLVPVDIIDLPVGMQRYAMFTNEQGGILDDLMVANLGNDELFLVVNAACKDQDLAHLRQHIGDRCTIEPLFEERALLALQGPAAVKVLARLAPEVTKMTFMQFAALRLLGVDCYVSRSGYTGEDGFEISVPAANAESLARSLLAETEVQAIGLGARDSLRLEAGLCLYGHDMNTDTTPIEASLLWAISKARRADGARAGGFPGADQIFTQQQTGVSRKRVGLLPQERTPVREGAEIVDADGTVIGSVCSGGFGPTLGGPLAMGYLDSAFIALDTEVSALVRGKKVPLRVSKMPFVPQRYYRG